MEYPERPAVMVDEASIAGTFALDELAAIAADAGAKLSLVGDPYHRPLLVAALKISPRLGSSI
jgi:hypothetical protein